MPAMPGPTPPEAPCADAGGRAAASASPHHAQSTRRRCGPPGSAPYWPGTWPRSWPPAGPCGQPWSLAPTLGKRGTGEEVPRCPGREGILKGTHPHRTAEIPQGELRKGQRAASPKARMAGRRWQRGAQRPPAGRLSFGRTRPAEVPSPAPTGPLPLSPMKFLQVWWSSLLRQLRGQPTSTVLCCSPPRPLDWMRCDMPSRTLQEVTTWQKPLTFSASIRRRMDWAGGAERGKSHPAPPHLHWGWPFSPGAQDASAPRGQGWAEGKVSQGRLCWAHLLGPLDLQVVFEEGAV